VSRLGVEALNVVIAGKSGRAIVEDVSFEVASGEVLGLVGESGSGKTTVALALLGHARRGLRIAGGSVLLDDTDVLKLAPNALRELRGARISYVPQDPTAALDPALRVGRQIEEVLSEHGDSPERMREALSKAQLPADADFLRRYPHQLSGGQRQRVAMAMAFACRPEVVVMDEPTTGLDVTTQRGILSTVRAMCGDYEAAAVYVTHDLAVVSELAHKVVVMYAGSVVERGPTDDVLRRPAHPYTGGLTAAVPDLSTRRLLRGIPAARAAAGPPPGCQFAPRCPLRLPECDERRPRLVPVSVEHLTRCIRPGSVAELLHPRPVSASASDDQAVERPLLEVNALAAGYGREPVISDVSLELRPGECVAVVGESGSGKTTLARCIVGLHGPYRGRIALAGDELPQRARERSAEARRLIQYVFQNPFGSLNPRRTVGASIAQPIKLFLDSGRAETARMVGEALERVSLPRATADRYADQLSGGQTQRVAIARALAASPQVLLCDEVTSALDVSVQASIVELLCELKAGSGLSLLFVTHNLALMPGIADRIVVMEGGRVVEAGAVEQVLAKPEAGCTRKLIDDTPKFSVVPELVR
jgi:peptide/nickel transport system ATP-binding protein